MDTQRLIASWAPGRPGESVGRPRSRCDSPRHQGYISSGEPPAWPRLARRRLALWELLYGFRAAREALSPPTRRARCGSRPGVRREETRAAPDSAGEPSRRLLSGWSGKPQTFRLLAWLELSEGSEPFRRSIRHPE